MDTLVFGTYICVFESNYINKKVTKRKKVTRVWLRERGRGGGRRKARGWGCGGQMLRLGGVWSAGEPGDGFPTVAAEGRRAACGGWAMIRSVPWKNRAWRHGVSTKAECPSVAPSLMARPAAVFFTTGGGYSHKHYFGVIQAYPALSWFFAADVFGVVQEVQPLNNNFCTILLYQQDARKAFY